MKVRLSQLTIGVFIVLATLAMFATETEGQRRRRPSRRITNPVSAQRVEPQSTDTGNSADAQIVSTAEERTGEETGTNQPRRRSRETNVPESEQDRLQRTVNTLSTQVTQMNEEMRRMQEQQRTIIGLERLTRAEERVENMRAQLREVVERESALQARAEAIEYEMQPDAIDRRAALTGARRPEEARDQIRRQLESERERVRSGLALLTANRARLETSISTADAEVERIRSLVGEQGSTPQPIEANSTGAQTSPVQTAPTTPAATTSPAPPPIFFN